MGLYRKKPMVIHAEQFFQRSRGMPAGVNYGWPKADGDMDPHPMDEKYWISTLEGPLHVSDGDWIITGVKGERYSCKPDIFEATYEFVGHEASVGP